MANGRHRERGPGLTRRDVIKGLGAGLGAVALGCDGPATICGGKEPSPGPAAAGPLGALETLVVVMMENRSFDHLLGALRMDPAYPGRHRIDGITGAESNPGLDGEPVHVWPLHGDTPGYGPRHDWIGCHEAWNDGANDRFVLANAAGDWRQPMCYYDREQVPYHYALADRYTVCDRWFASVLGPTWPNRFYLHAASSEGRVRNTPWSFSGPPTIWPAAASACVPAANYFAGVAAWYSAAFPGVALEGNGALRPERIESYFRAAREGTLPNFVLIDPDFSDEDLHPPHALAHGEAFIASCFAALAASPQWAGSLFVLVYDEHGGFFDHVAPPETADPRAAFRRLGFRVPAIVAGPLVRPGGVESTVLEHVSIAATLRARWGVRSLGPRMDAANHLGACLEPDPVRRIVTPPRDLPLVTVPRAAVRPWMRHGLDLGALEVSA